MRFYSDEIQVVYKTGRVRNFLRCFFSKKFSFNCCQRVPAKNAKSSGTVKKTDMQETEYHFIDMKN